MVGRMDSLLRGLDLKAEEQTQALLFFFFFASLVLLDINFVFFLSKFYSFDLAGGVLCEFVYSKYWRMLCYPFILLIKFNYSPSLLLLSS